MKITSKQDGKVDLRWAEYLEKVRQERTIVVGKEKRIIEGNYRKIGGQMASPTDFAPSNGRRY